MDEITIERIDNAIRFVARLIDAVSDAYWPILDRLEKERDDLLRRQARLDRYLGKPVRTERGGAVTVPGIVPKRDNPASNAAQKEIF